MRINPISDEEEEEIKKQRDKHFSLWQHYHDLVGGEGWQVNGRGGKGAIIAGPSSFVSTSFSILFHQLTRQMASPARVTQKAISVLPDPACADGVRE